MSGEMEQIEVRIERQNADGQGSDISVNVPSDYLDALAETAAFSITLRSGERWRFVRDTAAERLPKR
jgi:hypothetical protein